MSTSAHSLISDFKVHIAEGRLGHAYLFWGESPTAIANVCRAIIALLECGKTSCDGLCIDSREFGAGDGGTISIGSVREAITFLWQKPLRAARKTVFVNGADALSTEAQHAFLKTVEEPPEHGLILMSALDPRVIVAPLASRFQKIYVGSEGEEELSGAEKTAAQLAKKFVAGAVAERRVIIADVLEAEELSRVEQLLAHFVRHVLIECRKDPVKHVRLMGRLTERWAKMQDFNTNRKLQLETLLDA
ncbi:MAG: hypothetical protein Q7R85_00920 [bacterium]|nr:hypothetical protein [bacterium]